MVSSSPYKSQSNVEPMRSYVRKGATAALKSPAFHVNLRSLSGYENHCLAVLICFGWRDGAIVVAEDVGWHSLPRNPDLITPSLINSSVCRSHVAAPVAPSSKACRSGQRLPVPPQ